MEIPENQAIGSSININHEVARQHFQGRDLSNFDQDILKILCAVLNVTGPVRFTAKDVEEVDTNELVVEQHQSREMFIAMMVKPHEGMED